MKKISILLVLVAILSVTESFARRRGRITYGTVEKLEIVADLPNTDSYKMTDKTENGLEVIGYFDLAKKYSVFEIGTMPFWVKEEPIIVGKSTLYKDAYYDLKPEELDKILNENNLKKEDLLTLSFTDKYLGWLVLLGILVLSLVLRKLFPDKVK